MAGKKGKSQPSTSPSVRPTAAAKAILKASAWASPASSASVCTVAALADIGQNGDEPHKEGSDRVHNWVAGPIDDHVGLRAITHARDVFLFVQIDPDGKAL